MLLAQVSAALVEALAVALAAVPVVVLAAVLVARRVASRTEPAPDEIKPAPLRVPVGGAHRHEWPTISKRLLKGILL